MFSSKIFVKLILCFVAIIIFCAAISGIMIERQIKKDSLQDLEHLLTNQIVLLKESLTPQLLQDISFNLQPMVRSIGRNTGIRTTIIGLDGTVLADSDYDPKLMDNLKRRPEIVSANKQRYGAQRRLSPFTQTQMYFLASKFKMKPDTFGYVRVAVSIDEIQKKINHTRNVVVIAITSTAIMAIIIAFIIAYGFTKPVHLIMSAARDIADGNYSRRTQNSSSDEFGELARTLDRVAETAETRVHKLSEDRRRLDTIINSVTDSLIAVDTRGQVILMNEKAANIVNLDSEDAIGLHHKDVFNTRSISDAIDRSLLHREDGKLSFSRTVYPYGDFDISINLLNSKAGILLGAVISAHDMTDSKHMENLLQDFIANASHELKTPVTAIRGLSETILSDPEMDEQVRIKFVDKIFKQSLRLSKLVTDLLAVSRLDSQKTDSLDKAPVELTSLLKSVCEQIQPQIDEKQQSLKLYINSDQIFIGGDRTYLEQVMFNLIDNAHKYTQSGGTIEASLDVDNGDVIVRISDNGPGIAPHIQPRIFERFFRVDKVRSREMGGTGLGLPIVKRIVESHGGSISLSSEPNIGSSFTIRLPLER